MKKRLALVVLALVAVLQAMARHVGATRQNCNDDFFVIESRLIGSAA